MEYILQLACGHSVFCEYDLPTGLFYRCTECERIMHITDKVEFDLEGDVNESQ